MILAALEEKMPHIFDRESIALEGLSNHFFSLFSSLFVGFFRTCSDAFLDVFGRPGLTFILALFWG